ncbi:hypothetical protein [uncultured Croceitalea sp.]|uniref:hypothetical protein n=1 Tax=uncultured Croceitalea sp. TaxID=1798908 RepID=UPI0033067EE7
MSAVFEAYRPRSINFNKNLCIEQWNVKTYTITNKQEFTSFSILENVTEHLPVWLQQIENGKLPNYKQAFLIVHEAREGVWILLSWWTGGEMVETKVFFSSFDTPNIITDSPYNTNSLLCVWELEVFGHERASWIQHILQNPEYPDFVGYKNDTLNKVL